MEVEMEIRKCGMDESYRTNVADFHERKSGWGEFDLSLGVSWLHVKCFFGNKVSDDRRGFQPELPPFTLPLVPDWTAKVNFRMGSTRKFRSRKTVVSKYTPNLYTDRDEMLPCRATMSHGYRGHYTNL